MLNNEAFYIDKIQKLEADLNVYKRAYNDVDTERRQLEKIMQDAVREKEDLENQIKGYRVVALLDGDGTIFSPDLIAQGRVGGHAAAQKLSDHILQYLTSNFGANQYQLWVYVFLNKRGLVDTFWRIGNNTVKSRFDDFVTGFNQAAERFLMVDVGDAKEAADAKIKGCHDNGYVTNLRSQITAGFKQKMTLLRSYTEMATGIVDLELPILTIPELFLERKLIIPPPLPQAALDPVAPAKTLRIGSVECQMSLSAELDSSQQHQETLETENPAPPRQFSMPSSYSSVVQVAQKRVTTPDLDSSGSTTSDASDDLPELPIPTFKGSRHINPSIVSLMVSSETLWMEHSIRDFTLIPAKDKPPPCTLFYLANCKHGANCKYGHDYLLEAEHFNEIRLNAKKAPCPAINKGGV
ncbi:hypothetical protein C0992_000053 [Termitomyces sp. T32_za158]|nr:hypothetical protein C0992_000053 [Termitomyces sp. T32_za158]